ncbi:hypothetical protein J437_LFUL010315, partial [Ladona fulva]
LSKVILYHIEYYASEIIQGHQDLYRAGRQQGVRLSPILFNIAVEEVLEEIADMEFGVRIGMKINVLADHIAIFTESLDFTTLTEIFMKETEKLGLKINDTKT